MNDEYYYHYLGTTQDGKEKQRAYFLIKQGLEALSPSFPVPKLEGNALSEIFTLVSLDHPEIFYAPTFTCSFYPQAEVMELKPQYLFKKKEIQEHQKAIQSRIQKLVRPALELDELGREQYIHDFICRNVHYDKLKKAYSHEIIGPLTQGVGVCEGIAKTVKVLCDALKLPCIVAFCHNNPEKNIKYRHAWNLVRLNGKYYHLDATFDNTLSAGADIRYDYFNIDDASLFRDHEPLVWPVPVCPERTQFYYIRQKLSFTKPEDLRSRASQAVKKGRELTFHWRGGYLTRETMQMLCALLEEEARKREKTSRISLNWPQAVFRVSFAAIEPGAEGTSVRMEEANEGELL